MSPAFSDERGEGSRSGSPRAIRPRSESSWFAVADSAIVAGHLGRIQYFTISGQERSERRDRRGRILSYFKKDPPTGDEWLSFWGRTSARRSSVDAILGGGTPFVCLYMLGWFLGKHWLGWLVGATPFVVYWGVLLYLTLMDWRRFNHLWVAVLALSIMFYAFSLLRVESRTPKSFQNFQGHGFALVLETVMGSTLILLGLGLGALAEEWLASGTAKIILRLLSFISPVMLWSWMHEVVLDRQAAVLHRQNMSCWMTRSGPRGQKSLSTVRRLIENIVDRSRDLRVTGLNATELRTVANALDDGDYRKEAEYIRFYLRGGRPVNLFDRLSAFHLGYIYEMRLNETNGSLRSWVESKARYHHSGRPFEAIKRLRDGDELPTGLSRELRITGCAPRDSDRAGQKWWLCGAIARYRDDGGFSEEGPRGRRAWYALILAALCADGNPLAFIHAMVLNKNHSGRASRMSRAMEAGCEQVLRQISDAGDLYRDRGIVMTTSPSGSPPKVTYSVAAIWQAEVRKESIVMGEDAFNMFWDERDYAGLGEREKREILTNSVAWCTELTSYVDVTFTVYPVIYATGSTLRNIRGAAWRGWYMHTVWVVCAIFVHFLFPDRLMYMSAFSAAATELDWNNLFVHSNFVGLHMWRSAVGRVCLLFPGRRSDVDTSSMVRRTFFCTVLFVNWLAVYTGTFHAFAGRVFFLLVMGVSTIPGYVILMRADGRKDAHNLIEYIGRSRGPGYEHRRHNSRRWSLGKYTIVEQPEGVFKVLTGHQGGSERRSLGLSRIAPEGIIRWYKRIFVRYPGASHHVRGRHAGTLV